MLLPSIFLSLYYANQLYPIQAPEQLTSTKRLIYASK